MTQEKSAAATWIQTLGSEICAELCLSLQFYFWIFFVAYLETHALRNLTKKDSELEIQKQWVHSKRVFAYVGGAETLWEAQ